MGRLSLDVNKFEVKFTKTKLLFQFIYMVKHKMNEIIKIAKKYRLKLLKIISEQNIRINFKNNDCCFHFIQQKF